MRVNPDSGAVLPGPVEPIYVYEAPVRLWHWTMVLCMVVLYVTGYFIGSPPASTPGEAIDNYLLGWIRFAHFAAAYVFSIMWCVRIYWAIVGNHHARQLFYLPVTKIAWWRAVFKESMYYAFLGEGGTYVGHNPGAQIAMVSMYTVGTFFMIVTGFALYGEGLGSGSWADRMFGWVIPLFGQSQDVHTWHHLGMWYLFLFMMIHIYLANRQDIMSNATIVSTMINGIRMFKREE